MKILSQRNPAWSNDKLGMSPFTLGRYGCLTTCLSMASDWFGIYRDPAKMAKALDYTTEGYIQWDSLSKVGLKLLRRFTNWDANLIADGIKDPDKVCLLQVQGNHWVLAASKSILGGYNIIDPWFGDKSTTRRYRNQITGGAIVAKK